MVTNHGEFVRSFFGVDPAELLRNTLSITYPPYDIYKNKDIYSIVVATAGFKRDELSVTSENGQLLISGEKTSKIKEEEVEIIHQGIATRKFKLAFPLSSDMSVLEAEVVNGLLTVTIQQTKINKSNRVLIK